MLLSGLYQHGGYGALFAEPDKLAVKTRDERDRVAEFLMHQKPRAMRGLAKRINNEATPAAKKDHAIRTLASITGRQFHKHDPRHARNWLQTKQRF